MATYNLINHITDTQLIINTVTRIYFQFQQNFKLVPEIFHGFQNRKFIKIFLPFESPGKIEIVAHDLLCRFE